MIASKKVGEAKARFPRLEDFLSNRSIQVNTLLPLPDPISDVVPLQIGQNILNTTATRPDSKVIAQYQYPGLYFPRLTVTDTQGNAYTETIIAHVLSKEEIDVLLRSKWEGMKGAMANKDVEKALGYFVDNSKEMFRYNFELMKDLLPAIVQEMGEIQIVKAVGRVAEYQMIAVQDGMESSFCIKFVKDEEGIWRIYFF